MRRAAAVSRVFLVAATAALTFAIASAAQSPGYAAGFRLATVAAVDRPARDEILMLPGHAEHIRRLVQETGRPSGHVVLRLAGHYAFIAPFTLVIRLMGGEAASDPAGLDRAGFHRPLNRETAAFFASTLK